MQLSSGARSPLRLNPLSAALAVSLVALVALVPAVAAVQETQLAADTKPLIVGDIAGSELQGGLTEVLGVVWQNRGLSFIRWSGDDHEEGMTFEPAVALRGGFRATDPRLAACTDYMFAASVWKSDAGGNIGIDYFAPELGPHARGRYVLAPGTRPDIACLNGTVAVTYMSGGLARLAIFGGEGCSGPCQPVFHYNLGAAPTFGRAAIAATDVGFVVSWPGPGIYVQRFVLSSSGVSVKPLITVGQESGPPTIAADGMRVVLAYSRRGQTHMRISDDRGRTFGPRIVVDNFCLSCEGFSSPDSVDVRDGRIMVEVGRGFGIPPAVEQNRFLTANDGASWTKTPVGEGGDAVGVLLDDVLVEAWDTHHYAGSTYGNVAQEIRFRAQNLP